MRLSIRTKWIIIMLILTVVPLGVLGYTATNDVKHLGTDVAEDARVMGEGAVDDSTAALDSLGEAIIEQKGKDVAKQLEVYIKQNPGKTVVDLQTDQYCRDLAVQPVGQTGYTAVTDVDTLICRFHKAPTTENLDLHVLATKLPGFWAVMSQTEGGHDSEGYYDWQEPDGSIRQKYMYIAVVDARTADNVQFSVAATTYIDEFSQPAVATQEKINAAMEATAQSIDSRTDDVMTRNIIIIVAIVIVAAIIAFFVARSVTKPVRQLTAVADKISKGEMDVSIDIKSKDEIGDLAKSFERMVAAVRFLSQDQKEGGQR